MSDSKRDQRHRPHSAKLCWDSRNGGCPRCVTGEYKTASNRRERREAKREIRDGVVD